MSGRALAIAAAALAACGPALAQSSASYTLEEHVLNAGGRPAQAVVAVSASFKVSLDSIGDALAGRAMTGPSYHADAGLVSAYVPPGEVTGLVFLGDGSTLQWSPEPGSMSYEVYAASIASLPGDFGGCAQADLAGTSWIDPSSLAPGDGRFYLVTGKNRLWEEGTKGWSSSGVERANSSPCP